MKVFVVAVILATSVVADVSHIVNTKRADQLRSNQVYPTQSPIPILRQAVENNGYGNYKFNYETGNGIQVTEESQLKNAGTKDEVEASHGSYSYVGDDGVTYTVNWIADENGFRASGAHIPEAIQQSVQELPQIVQQVQEHASVQKYTPVNPKQFVNRFAQVQEPTPVKNQQFDSQFVQIQESAKENEQQFINRFIPA